MTTDQNLEQLLGLTYRQHPAFSNSDFNYVFSPFILKSYKNGELLFEEKDYHIMGRAFETYLVTPAAFNDEFQVVPNEYTTPSSGQQHSFVAIVLQEDGLENLDELIYRAYRESYKVTDKDLETGKYKSKAIELYDTLSLHIRISKTGKPAITQYVFDTIKVMVTNALKNPFWIKTIGNGSFHVLFGVKLGVLNNLEIHNVPVKGEIDCLVFNEDFSRVFIIDFKTTVVAITEFPEKLVSYGYHRQIAFYSHLVKLDLESKDSVIKKQLVDKYKVAIDSYNFTKISGEGHVLAVEKKHQNHAKFFPITKELYEDGSKQIVEYLSKIKFYIETNFENYIEEKQEGVFQVNYTKWLSK